MCIVRKLAAVVPKCSVTIVGNLHKSKYRHGANIWGIFPETSVVEVKNPESYAVSSPISSRVILKSL